MRRLVRGLGAIAALLSASGLVRTLAYGAPQAAAEPEPTVAMLAGAAERLAGSLRIPTVSHEDPAAFDAGAFAALHAHLEQAFPRAHAELLREKVGDHSLLYTWRGADPALPPILLAAHQDVVPVEPGTEASWREDPFGGRIADGFVWGRGAIDNKSAVVGTLEAVEMLLGEGFRPARTVLLAFGHDEEVGGSRGAREIAALLERRGVRLEMVLDEGGVIGEGVMPGVEVPTALVGIAEKGFLSVELTSRGAGGHSSLPPAESAIGILGQAIARLERNPMPARMEEPTRRMFERIAPRLPFPQRAALANQWLTRPLVMRGLEGSPNTNAMVRTTLAPTLFQAGTKDNVLASQARAVVNVRILQGDSVEGVLAHVRRVIDDERIEVRPGGAFSAEPSPVSSPESEGFRTLEGAIRSVFPDAIVAPYQVVVVTDARYYAPLSRSVFRFLPLRLGPQDLQRMHGTDERVAVRDYESAVRLYRRFIRDAAGG